MRRVFADTYFWIALLNDRDQGHAAAKAIKPCRLRFDAGNAAGRDTRSVDGLDAAFAAFTQARVQAVMVSPDTIFFMLRKQISELAASAGLPAIYGYRDHVEAGGLMSYGPDSREQYRRAATYVDRILKGAKPEDLPVEQATKIELVLNLRTARALGISVPPFLLARADEVIE